ncbi:MAG: FHA domain-containing protein [Tissierellia bacterium]|nr:FHA domain-containing protein [Tissierellia bacterium]
MKFIFDTLRAIFFTDIVGNIDLYTIISTVFKYLFVFVVLYFIYLVVKLIFLDIKTVYKDQSVKKSFLSLQDGIAEGSKLAKTFILDDFNAIGRDYENDLIIDDTMVSRRHAIIVRKNDGFYIEDMQSSNGTFVNEQQIFTSDKLNQGDKIQIGNYHYVFNQGDENSNEVQ